MEDDVSGAVNAFLCDDSGSDWEKEICDESETSLIEARENDNSSPEKNDFDGTEDDTGVPPSSAKHMEVLKSYFGHSSFRPMQWKIIHSIIEKRQDNCVIMATGYGKSLCYQYPALYSQGTTVVISPLISLMQDQVLSLEVANISACFLGSAQSDKNVKTRVMDGEYRVVYMTPEYVTGDYGSKFIQEMMMNGVNVTLIAVDEAHCVSQWGHDFRSSYRKLGKLRDGFPNVPFLAVTATATPEVIKDIIKSLHLRNAVVTCTGFDRPNLYLKVLAKSSNVIDDLRPFMVKCDGHWTFRGSTIIYCPTKKKTSSIADCLKGLGVECEEYHAGLRNDIRKDAHEKFVKDQIKVIVATVAFGMGIDKPDVRLIIHYGAPRDIESYYQEIGRAGRDGLPSSCLVFFNSNDFVLNRHFLTAYKTPQFQKHKEEMSMLLESYLETSECRRKLLLSHFKDSRMCKSESGSLSKTCCDNCSRKVSYGNMGVDIDKVTGLDGHGRFDFTEDAQLLLGAVKSLGGRFGLTIPVLFLRGSRSNKLNEDQMKQPLFGKGKNKAEAYWKNLGRLLIRSGYLVEAESKPFRGGFGKKSFPYTTVSTSEKGEQFLKFWKKGGKGAEKNKLLLVPPVNMLDSIKSMFRKDQKATTYTPVSLPSFSAENIFSGSVLNESVGKTPPVSEKEKVIQHQLYRELIELRNHLAVMNNCMPYMVASDKSIVDMAKFCPSTCANLSRVDGFNAAKIKKFGDALVDKVINFCQRSGLRLDNFPQDKPCHTNEDMANDSMNVNLMLASLSDTVRATYVAFQVNKKSMEEVASERGLKISTLAAHLGEAIRNGLDVDLKRLGFTLDAYKTIENVICSSPFFGDYTHLTPIKNSCPPTTTWEDIKFAVAVYQLKCSIKDSNKFKEKLNKLFSIQEGYSAVARKPDVSLSKFAFSQSVESSLGSSTVANKRTSNDQKSKPHPCLEENMDLVSSKNSSPAVKSYIQFSKRICPSKLGYDDDDDETDIEDEIVEKHALARLKSSSSIKNLESKELSLQTSVSSPKIQPSSGGTIRNQFDLELELASSFDNSHRSKSPNLFVFKKREKSDGTGNEECDIKNSSSMTDSNEAKITPGKHSLITQNTTKEEQFPSVEEFIESNTQALSSSHKQTEPSPTFKRARNFMFGQSKNQECKGISGSDCEKYNSPSASKPRRAPFLFSETKQKLSQFSFLKNESHILSTPSHSTTEIEGQSCNVHENQEPSKFCDDDLDKSEYSAKIVGAASDERLAESSETSSVKDVGVDKTNTFSGVCEKVSQSQRKETSVTTKRNLETLGKKLEMKKKRAKLANI